MTEMIATDALRWITRAREGRPQTHQTASCQSASVALILSKLAPSTPEYVRHTGVSKKKIRKRLVVENAGAAYDATDARCTTNVMLNRQPDPKHRSFIDASRIANAFLGSLFLTRQHEYQIVTPDGRERVFEG